MHDSWVLWQKFATKKHWAGMVPRSVHTCLPRVSAKLPTSSTTSPHATCCARRLLRKHCIEKCIFNRSQSETPLDRYPTLRTYREEQFGSLSEGGTNPRPGDAYDLFVLRLLNRHRPTHSTIANVDLSGVNSRYRAYRHYQYFRAVARRLRPGQ